MWSSFEDAGALVDGLGPQADILVLELFRRAVHRLGNKAALWYLTLQKEEACAQINTRTHAIGSLKEISVWEVKIDFQIIKCNSSLTIHSPPRKSGMISLSM